MKWWDFDVADSFVVRRVAVVVFLDCTSQRSSVNQQHLSLWIFCWWSSHPSSVYYIKNIKQNSTLQVHKLAQAWLTIWEGEPRLKRIMSFQTWSTPCSPPGGGCFSGCLAHAPHVWGLDTTTAAKISLTPNACFHGAVRWASTKWHMLLKTGEGNALAVRLWSPKSDWVEF